MNGLFTHLYLNSFIKSNSITVGLILETIVRNLSPDNQKELYFKLQDYLIDQGLLSAI
jgi:phosphatidate cytidylyltransferase